jgi:hypothetical protein
MTNTENRGGQIQDRDVRSSQPHRERRVQLRSGARSLLADLELRRRFAKAEGTEQRPRKTLRLQVQSSHQLY